MSKYSCEGVGRGHPDKIADLIADSILDALIQKLGIKKARFAGEVLVSSKKIVIAGEGSSVEGVTFRDVASKVLLDLGYEPKNFEFIIDYKNQSQELFQLNSDTCKLTQDQGIVFGFATSETEDYLPLEYCLTKKLILKTKELIQNKVLYWAKEDYKVLVNLKITRNNNCLISKLNFLVFSIHHTIDTNRDQIIIDLKEKVIYPCLKELNVLWDSSTLWYINSSGNFQIGGLIADTGVTNRKQIVDAFGPAARNGGGGLCGKDLTKIDRLGSYYARWVAKNLVAASLATKLELKITYAIAQEEALSYEITFFENLKIEKEKIIELIKVCFPTKVSEIFNLFTSLNISFFKLTEISNFGNFISNLPWEKLNRTNLINEYLLRT